MTRNNAQRLIRDAAAVRIPARAQSVGGESSPVWGVHLGASGLWFEDRKAARAQLTRLQISNPEGRCFFGS